MKIAIYSRGLDASLENPLVYLLNELVKYFNKDHSTIVHAYERVQKALKNNDRTRKELKDILTLLKRKR